MEIQRKFKYQMLTGEFLLLLVAQKLLIENVFPVAMCINIIIFFLFDNCVIQVKKKKGLTDGCTDRSFPLGGDVIIGSSSCPLLPLSMN